MNKTPREIEKEHLLEHYQGKEPYLFYQVDGFTIGPEDFRLVDWLTAGLGLQKGDSVSDKDGDVVFERTTSELMSTCPSVRLLIPLGASFTNVRRLLKKILAHFIAQYGEEGEEAPYYPSQDQPEWPSQSGTHEFSRWNLEEESDAAPVGDFSAIADRLIAQVESVAASVAGEVVTNRRELGEDLDRIEKKLDGLPDQFLEATQGLGRD